MRGEREEEEEGREEERGFETGGKRYST